MTATSVADERNFRPKTLDGFIGQAEVKKTLRLMLDSAHSRGTVLEHVVFFGPPGLGKTTLAAIIAAEMGGKLFELSASSVKKGGDLASVLAKINKNDVVFLDEIHALPRDVAEILYSAMEDFVLNILLGDDKPPLRVSLPPYTLVGATTDYGLLPEPMRARFGQSFHLQIYTLEELRQVVSRAADNLGFMYDDDALDGIARRSRGTPRVALRLFRRCVDAATNARQDFFDGGLVEATMPILGLKEEAVSVKDFLVDVEGNPTPILKLPYKAPDMGTHANDPDLSEYLVKVEWLKTFKKEQAKWEKGMFANRNSACRLRNSFTIERLTELFGLVEASHELQDLTFPIPVRAQHRGGTFHAELLNIEGCIRYENKEYETPTTAANAIITDWKEVNGWDFWRYLDAATGKWEKIGRLRKEP